MRGPSPYKKAAFDLLYGLKAALRAALRSTPSNPKQRPGLLVLSLTEVTRRASTHDFSQGQMPLATLRNTVFYDWINTQIKSITQLSKKSFTQGAKHWLRFAQL